MRSAKKNNGFIAFTLMLSLFISCGVFLGANDMDAIGGSFGEIDKIEPQIYQDDFFIFPLDTQIITSYFGNRKDPINGGRHFHNGVDFSARIGETVIATMGGVVSVAEYHPGYGNYIKINHGNGYKTMYSHLSSFSVEKGDAVARGQKIGESGNTGNSSGPHLHFTMYDSDDQPINPLEYLKLMGGEIIVKSK